MTSHSIRIATYNVRGFKDNHAALLRVIRAIAPDVLLLQEVPRHPFSGHRVAQFAADTGLTWSAGKRFRMSTTLLTGLRLNLLDAHHVALPVRPRDEPRGYALATVALPGHSPILVASLHMSLRADDRKAAVPLVLQDVHARGLPAVIGGDLNEPPGHEVWNRLAAALPLASADGFTFPSDAPAKRIDAIFASAGLPVSRPDVAWDQADLPRATDHLPLVVDVDLASLAS